MRPGVPADLSEFALIRLLNDDIDWGAPMSVHEFPTQKKDRVPPLRSRLGGQSNNDHKKEAVIAGSSSQKEAEDALRRSEEKYRGILEEMEEGYYEVDLEGNYTYVNKAVRKMHGYSAEELMGMNYRQYLSPEQAEKNSQIFLEIYQTGKSRKLDGFEVIRKDGSILFAEASAYPLRNSYGKIKGFWGICRDLTEERKSELALQKSEEKYRLLVNNANDGVFITQQGCIKYYNPRTARITGYSDQDLMGLPFADLVHPKDRANIYDVQERKLQEGESPEIFAFRILNRRKEILWVELSAIGITWEGESAILNFMRDVTHQKKIEAQLLQAQKMEAIGTLAGGIAHDFNNILASIIGFTELVLEDVDDISLAADNLTEVLIAGKRAKDLVHQILTFARRSEEKIEPVVVSTIAKEALRLMRSSLPTTIAIEQEIASDAAIMGNPTQVHQIIMNLCTNAAHAMEETGGTLSVDLANVHINPAKAKSFPHLDGGDYLKLSISDTGCGIPSKNINTIFEPFFTTKGTGQGTGMGLSVVQGIVENYGGKISVQSEEGQGTTFTIHLPVSKMRAAVGSEQPEAARICTERILMIDDELPILKMGRQMLTRLGYAVTTQSDCLEALKLFQGQPQDFDLVVTDMTMPHMTGDRLAREMMEIRCDIPVVLCTGYSNQITEESAARMGIKAFIYKPLVKREFADTIRQVLDSAI